jgi:hypothetical protein
MFGPVTIGPVEIPEPPPLVGLTIAEVGEIAFRALADFVGLGFVGLTRFVGLAGLVGLADAARLRGVRFLAMSLPLQQVRTVAWMAAQQPRRRSTARVAVLSRHSQRDLMFLTLGGGGAGTTVSA